MLNIKVVTWTLALFTTLSYLFCLVYSVFTPGTIHMLAFLQQVLPGYEPNSWSGFSLGLIKSFLWGVYIGIVYVPIYNLLFRRWATSSV